MDISIIKHFLGICTSLLLLPNKFPLIKWLKTTRMYYLKKKKKTLPLMWWLTVPFHLSNNIVATQYYYFQSSNWNHIIQNLLQNKLFCVPKVYLKISHYKFKIHFSRERNYTTIVDIQKSLGDFDVIGPECGLCTRISGILFNSQHTRNLTKRCRMLALWERFFSDFQ